MGRRSGRVLLLMALFELARAGGFWLLAGIMPGGREGMLITAGILGFTGLVLVVVAVVVLWRAAATDRISATGMSGTGQIMSRRQAGVLVNGQPNVGLTNPGAEPGPV